MIRQPDGGLDVRIAHAMADAHRLGGGGPVLLVGMDTPHLGPGVLRAAVDTLRRYDAVLGPATDGGYWAIGLRRPEPDLVVGVPMSAADTCTRQHERLRSAGLSVGLLPAHRDVDTIDDARHVATLAPHSRFAAALLRADRVQMRPSA